MFKDFKEFAMRGNVVDLADHRRDYRRSRFFQSFSGSFEGGQFTRTRRGEKTGRGSGLGQFLTVVVNFLIVAFVLFLAVRALNKLKKPEVPPHPRLPLAPRFSSNGFWMRSRLKRQICPPRLRLLRAPKRSWERFAICLPSNRPAWIKLP
jgi:large conductance mechanosensitive channel